MRELNKGQPSKVEGGGEGEISKETGFTFLPSLSLPLLRLPRTGAQAMKDYARVVREARRDGVRRTLTCAELSTFRFAGYRDFLADRHTDRWMDR